MFTIPSMKKLVAVASKLPDLYQVKRDEFDSQRFFASSRSKTVNPTRIEDTNFVKNLAEHVHDNKFRYSSEDNDFTGKDYNKDIVPHLKYVITGAMLLELSRVTNSYTFESRVQNWSALGAVVLEEYGIDKLSEVPEEDFQKSLTALRTYLQVYSNHQFHPSKSNDDILEEISTCMPIIEANAEVELSL